MASPTRARGSPRHARPLFAAAAWLCGVVLIPAGVWTQEPDQLGILTPGREAAAELVGGGARAFAVAAQAGEYLLLTVEPQGLDVVVALLDPKGRPLLEVDAAPGPRGVETVAWVAEVAGAHRVEVRPRYEGRAAGSCAVLLEGPRQPTTGDRERAAAERGLSDGLRLQARVEAEPQRQAIETLESALALWRSVGDRGKQTAALLALARAALTVGEPARAAARLDEALILCRAGGEPALEAAVLAMKGVALNHVGAFGAALEALEAAVTAAHDSGNEAAEAEALNNAGAAHGERGDNDRALESYERALVLFRALGHREYEAVTLANIAIQHGNSGDYQKAIELLHEVVPLQRAVGDRYGEAFVLNNLGTVHHGLGDRERALGYYEEALPIFREVGNPLDEALVLHNMARAFTDAGDLDRARATYSRVLELEQAGGATGAEAVTLLNLGDTHRRTGDRAKAYAHTHEALALARGTGQRAVESSALLQLALLEAQGGDLGAARERALEAVSSSREVQAPKRKALALYRLAWIERARGDLASARRTVEQALEIVESHRVRFSSADLRAAYVATLRDVYELHVDVLMQLHARDPESGHDRLAFQAAERARSRSLLELLAEARARVREGVAPDLLARERALRGRLNAAAERRLRAAPGAGADTLDQEIERLMADLGRTEAEIRATSPRYAALTQPTALSASEAQGLVGSDTLLLEYFLGEERSFVWFATGDTFGSRELPPRSAVEAAARRAHEAMSRPDGDWREAAAYLSRVLLAPVADRLKASRIVAVADGALEYVPLAALPRPGWEELLVERHEVVGVPSASTLRLLRLERPRMPSKTLAVLADPVFDAGDERVRPGTTRSPGRDRPAGKPRESGSASLSRAAADLNLGGALPRLPFTRREALAILAGIPEGQALAAFDFEASQATVTDPGLEPYRFIHFATHGLLNTVRPELSGLVLSLVDREGRPQDGFLSLPAIFNLRLSADLVVLSGCRTALGREIRSEGLVGLTRGFMYAGAPRVLASLWAVDDAATAELMASFYGRLRERRTAAASLRQAQLAMMGRTRFRHPYYWAAFQLQGEWR